MARNRALFTATDLDHGKELWITDGTTAGTKLLKDIYPGTNTSNPSGFVTLANGRTLFAATDDGSAGRELWITDGTASGTRLFKDLSAAGSSSPQNLTMLRNGKIVFSTSDSVSNGYVWVSDGTATGTVSIANMFGPSNGNTVGQFTPFGANKAVFTGYDFNGSNGAVMWVTNGTTAGTFMLKAFGPGDFPGYLTDLGNGRMIFGAFQQASGYEMWVTAGTTGSTQLLKDINPGGGYGFRPSGDATPLALGNGRAIFRANDGTHGDELWITDGTAAGTRLLKDTAPGSPGGGVGGFAALSGNKVVFSADGELWVSDGTAAGTRLVLDITPGLQDKSRPIQFTSLGDGRATFVFSIDPANGQELWVTDGTAAGTRVLQDIAPGGATSNPSVPVLLPAAGVLNGTATADTLVGTGLANKLYGFAGADKLNGKGGGDVLYGGLGKDILTGGAGKDAFVFDTKPENDLITDFSKADGDQIRLSKAIFSGINHTGPLTAAEFHAAAGAVSAHDASDRIVYNTTTGALYYDADGLGGTAAVAIATLGGSTHPALAFSDILMIA